MKLSELIAKLEEAEEGSRDLDEDIAFVLGWTHVPGSRTTMAEAVWIDPDEIEHEHPPQWSTSLDAKLPWERIVFVKLEEHERGNKRFTALHRREGVAMQRWKEGKGSTEPLARRIAALKAKDAST